MLTTETIKERVTKSYPNVLVLSPYLGKSNPILLKCINCNHEWSLRGETVSRLRFVGCPKCTNTERITREKYEQSPKFCLYCNEKLEYQTDIIRKKFCNHSCAASYNNPRSIKKKEKTNKISLYCLNCGTQLINAQKKYCSQICQHEYNYKQNISLWKDGKISGMSGYGVSKWLRRYLFEKYSNQCSRCGWHEVNPTTGLIPLEVEHIDGNHENNSEENLTLLCPNCHSLTPTFRSLNKGNGRKERRKYDLN